MSTVDAYRQRYADCQAADDGFTLIELLVVLLIIGILLAIAIPTFLSVTKNANNTAAQSNLQTAFTGAKAYYTNSGENFIGLLTGSQNGTATSSIQSIDTGLSYVSGGVSNGPHLVSVQSNAAGSDLVLTAFSAGTKDCWGMMDVTAAGSTIDGIAGSSGIGTYFFVNRATTSANCNASQYLGGTVAVSASSITGFPHG